MKDRIYKGYIIDKSQKDRKIFNSLNVSNKKMVWMGLITILEITVSEKELDEVIDRLQKNMVDHIGYWKQEFYFHLYCKDELIVVFKRKIFYATSDKSTWAEAREYGIKLGIVSKQLDFLTPEENDRRYFSKGSHSSREP